MGQDQQTDVDREGTILLVEDDDVLAHVVKELLAPVGAVHWVTSGEDAVTLIACSTWDLIVTDIELPGMTGLELLERTARERRTASVLILTSHASFDHAVTAIRAGADDYMTKPFEPAQLVAKALSLTDLARERRLHALDSVLAIGAHPDDVEIGCGGILLKHAAAGDVVSILTLTGGEAGGEVRIRAEESRRAAALLRARLFHADLSDTSVSDGGKTIAAIKRVIDETSPTTVYTHTPRDVHQDHRNVHSATLVAARSVPRLYCYQSPSTSVEFRPTRFVDIDEFLARKLDVIGAYTSQVETRRYLDEDLLRATARYWSRFGQSRYVEPLEAVRESDMASERRGTVGDRRAREAVASVS